MACSVYVAADDDEENCRKGGQNGFVDSGIGVLTHLLPILPLVGRPNRGVQHLHPGGRSVRMVPDTAHHR